MTALLVGAEKFIELKFKIKKLKYSLFLYSNQGLCCIEIYTNYRLVFNGLSSLSKLEDLIKRFLYL